MGATVQVKCHCGKEFTAREADRKRGWARSCSKSCAATKNNRKTGNFQRFCELKEMATSAEYDDGPCDFSYLDKE